MSTEIWVELIQQYAVLATASTAILAALIFCYKRCVKPLFQAIKKYDELCQKVDKIFYEITPNEGKSIKDSIGKIELKLVHVSEIQLAVLADHEDAFFKTDPQGNYIWINRTYVRSVGRVPSELIGHGWQNAIHSDERDSVVTAWYKAVEEDREVSMDVKFETPAGKIIPAKIRSYRMTDSLGDIVGYLGNVKFLDNDK